MALSPAKRHFIKTSAAMAAEATPHGATVEGLQAYEQQLAQLHQDRLRLSQVQGNERKAELKRQLVPAYAPYIEGVLEAGQGAQDDVLGYLMVWRIDIGDYQGALDIAEYVLRHGLALPDRFERSSGCLVAEEIAEAALKAQKTKDSFDLDVLHRTLALTDDQDMPDEARAKLYLAAGRATLEGLTQDNPGPPGKLQAGADLLKRAIELHSMCGGKQAFDAATRLLNKLAAKPGG